MDKRYVFTVHGDEFWQWALKMILGVIMFPVTLILSLFGENVNLK